MAGIREVLSQSIPREKAFLMHHSYDLIGDAAIVRLPSELNGYEKEVGTAFHSLHPQIRRVFKVVGETREIERNRELKLIWTQSPQQSEAGDVSAENVGRTVYTEHGCRFVVDPEKVFFTPRLAYERGRIARQIRPGEVIAVLFGGVGTYAIVIAKICPSVKKIFTVDINPVAHELAVENTTINRCSQKVVPIMGDARALCRVELRGLCDRVIMPLPEKANLFLDCATAALKEDSENTVNFYAEVFGCSLESRIDRIINNTKTKLAEYGVNVSDVVSWRIVREVGPRRYHVAVDIKVIKQPRRKA